MNSRVGVQNIPPGYGRWNGLGHQTESFDKAVKRGEVVELSRHMTRHGRLTILYRRLKDPAPRWRKPALIAVGLLTGFAVTGTALYFLIRAVWEVMAALAPIVIPILLLIAFTRLNHRGACPGLHCGGCRR